MNAVHSRRRARLSTIALGIILPSLGWAWSPGEAGRDLAHDANPAAWFTPWGGAAVAVTGALMVVDQPIAREARRADHDAGWAKGLRTTADLASAPIPLAFGVAGWAIGAGTKNPRLEAAGQAAIISAAAAVGTVHILKFAIGRIRPNSSGDSPDAFRFEPFTSFGNALPSGHTAGAAALAGVLSKAYPGWPTWAAVALTVAAGTARIVDGNHWISDVALGGAIGFHMGRRAAAGRMDALSVRF